MCSDSKLRKLIVPATGGVNAMTFMLSASVVSQICVNYCCHREALQTGILQTCLRAGAHAVTWAHRNAAGAQTVLVCSERATQTDNMIFVKSKHFSGRLGAIYVDKGHLMVQWV